MLLTIGIIAILAAVVIVAINPQKQLASARNAQRFSDVNGIISTFWQYAFDHSGRFQPLDLHAACQIDGTLKPLCKTDTSKEPDGCQLAGCAYSRHLSGSYIASFPPDPLDLEDTPIERMFIDYYVLRQPSGRLRVVAPRAELDADIAVEQ